MLTKDSVKVFGKSQVSAFLGGIFDWSVMVACVEWFGIFYVFAIWISGFLGALVNFSLNKYWAFEPTSENIYQQLLKFFSVVVLGSVLLKSGGTYLMTETLHLDYRISRILVDLVVSLGYNYTIQRLWIFKKEDTQNSGNNSRGKLRNLIKNYKSAS
ncbi:MAG: GtrA family protein [Chitinophagales bacterium]|nr:GtrA family protein [Chitinophagales bacterium]